MGTAYIHYGDATGPMQTCLVKARRADSTKPGHTVFQIQRHPGGHWQRVYESGIGRATFALVNGEPQKVTIHGTEID